MTENAIEIHNLRKVYKAQKGQEPKEALKGVDLTIPRGSIFGLLGPNGAGKSTLINILAGLVTKTSGTATIWGFDIERNPRNARRSIGIVPQELNLDPFFTPREVLEIQAGLYGVPARMRKTDDILEAVGLADKADAYARSLSGGMRRRMLVAKAMVHSPPILVLDEPTAGVDISLRQQLWAYVRSLNDQGCTIVLTTHYLQEAEEMCDQIAIIHEGDLVACEPTGSLLKRLDVKRLVVTPETPLSTAPSISEFDVQMMEDGRVSIAYAPSRVGFETVLEAVREAGFGIRDLSTEEANLEDIFLSLTSDR